MKISKYAVLVYNFQTGIANRSIVVVGGGGGGGTQIWFGQGCAAQASKPITISRGQFSRKKTHISQFSGVFRVLENLQILKKRTHLC